MIGPFRGGRTVAAAGIASQPNVFYVAANNGGVWKTDDYGRIWHPIFDDQPSGSIGARRHRALRSEHNLRRQRRGRAAARIYRSAMESTNPPTRARPGGISGLRDGQQISAILVDPRDPNECLSRC